MADKTSIADNPVVKFILKIMGECNEVIHASGVKYVTWVSTDGHAFRVVPC